MATHIALLRGINVGGHNRVAMPELREVVASLGHTGVATYIQSGNVVFTAGPVSAESVSAESVPAESVPAESGQADHAELASALEQAIAGALGVKPAVVVLSRDDLAQTMRDNPYPEEPNPKMVHAVFFGTVPDGLDAAIEAAMQRDAAKGGHGRARVVGRTLFVHTPTGFGTSELAAHLLGRKASPAAAGTARNWATVTRLAAMCDE